MSKVQDPMRLRMSLRLLALASISVLAVEFARSADAQTAAAATAPAVTAGQVKEVVVTAERRKSTVQKTAASISVRNGDAMLQQGRITVAQILEDVPGVSGAPNTGDNPATSVVIRGVIPDNTLSNSASPTTGLYVDGVIEGLGGNYDIDNVQVLRGPQGTLYGRTATSGVIVTTTRDPMLGKFALNLTGTYGSYDLRDAQVGINIPLGSVLAIRFAGHEADQHGYLSTLGGATETTEGRVKLLYNPAPWLSAMIAAAGVTNTTGSGGPQYNLIAPGQIQYASTTPLGASSKDHSRQYWGVFNSDLGFGTLTYIPAYRAYFQNTGLQDVGPPTGPVGVGANDTSLDQYVTQEMRIAADPGSPVSWVGGVFYYNQMYKNFTNLIWLHSNALAFDQEMRELTQDVGVFGDAVVPVTSSLRLTGGLRWDWSNVEFSESYINNDTRTCGDGIVGPACGPGEATFGLPQVLTVTGLSKPEGTRTWTNITYRVRAEYDVTPLNMVYGSVSTGFVPGDVRVGGNPQTGVFYPAPFGEETLTAFEIGSHNRFLDQRLQVNASLYYNIFSGYEDNVQLTPTIPGSPTIVMTAPARQAGADLEVTYRLTPVDRLGVTFGETDARFVNRPTYIYDGAAYPFADYVEQKRIPGIAPTTVAANYDHTFEFQNGSSLDAQAYMNWESGFYEVAQNSAYPSSITLADLYQGPEVFGNVSLTWRSPSDNYTIGGYIRNIADSKYVNGINPQYNGEIGAAPTIGRTFGLQLHASY